MLNDDELEKFMKDITGKDKESKQKEPLTNEQEIFDKLNEALGKNSKFAYEQSIINYMRPTYEDMFFKLLLMYVVGGFWKGYEDKGKDELEKIIETWRRFIRSDAQRSIESCNNSNNSFRFLFGDAVSDGEDLRLVLNKALKSTETLIRGLFDRIFKEIEGDK